MSTEHAAGSPIPVILDVDTGIDDALALLLAAKSPALDLLAVSCVSGNAPVDQVVRNTLKVLDAAGATDVPVARGADRPLLEPPRDARHMHGDDGMGDLGLADSARTPVDMHAIELMRTTLESATRPVTLVPLAPMTNVALLLRAYPHVAENMERILFMGGAAAIGNATAAAEFNVWHDPEAAGIVLTSGLPVTMYGLDVFYEVTIDEAGAAGLVASPDPAAQLAGRLLQRQQWQHIATIGDAGAVAAVIEPDGLTTSRYPVRIELADTWTRGQTLVDRRSWAGDLEHDPHGLPAAIVDVALRVDADRYRALFLDTLSRSSTSA
ncbi:MAG: nucleoside hydrolase [Sporichthyaceae bacterium]